MKFSYTLLKQLVPGIKNKKELIEKLNLHFFEVEDLGRNVLDISIPANRFSDAASHFGIAREIAAILGLKYKEIQLPKINRQSLKVEPLKIKIHDKNLCSRYAAQYFENIKVAPSPKWMQKILIDCGLRPINNVVDIMNYAMLETGQPLHAFDFDKLKTIIVRRAKKGEKITTLDDKIYELNENVLVIADEKSPLAIAGIKGGKKAEVDKNTKRIIVEAAHFNGTNIYKSSKILKLATDASLRFSHNITPTLVVIGLNRAAQLLQEVIKVKPGPIIDINFTKPHKKIIKFNLEKFNQFIGLNLDIKTCCNYLERLGFRISQRSNVNGQQSFLVEVPLLRQDIETFEDLAEEVVRLYGYNRIKSIPPHVHLIPSGFEDQIVLENKIRQILIGMGLNEVSNYAFISGEDKEKIISLNQLNQHKSVLIELENPISEDKKYLRPSLAPHLLRNIETNFRFFDSVKIFEIGKIFFKDEKDKLNEKLRLGIALASQDKNEIFFELKGMVKELFGKIGLVDYLMPAAGEEVLKIKSDSLWIGYLAAIRKEIIKGDIALAEIDLDELLKLVVAEREYRALPKYPSVMRDISILVDDTVRVGDIMQTIQLTDLKYIEDVDLIDEYDKAPKRSLTFRIVFQAEDKTLTDDEVNQEIEKIVKALKTKFMAIIR